jgi:hypothetical protein
MMSAGPIERTLPQKIEDGVITGGFALFGIACLLALPFASTDSLGLALITGLLSMSVVLNGFAVIKAPWGWPANTRPYAGRWHTAIRLAGNVAFAAFLLGNLAGLEMLYEVRGDIGRALLGLDFA